MSKQTKDNAKEIAAEAARQTLLQERQDRTQACRQEIEAVLKKHKCAIQPQLMMTPQGSQWMVDFIAQE